MADPDEHAAACAQAFAARHLAARLGLIPAARGADALAAAGWEGPLNYEQDTAKISAVVRSWEDRFGVRVVAAGFATLHLSVAWPPTRPQDALLLAAEHAAFCPDVLGYAGHPPTLAAYAERLVGAESWDFWWD
ncbi:DUF4253 domain-containing protein [Streptomyces sp. MNP-20]|uniref:DUF4253 domain-containing protein n=1 Tax=Streptomyces sp. MNP-20 TaxID=2721165 RepID=UPI002815839B|nr:DUF4253 domain-containing protein [Streptomyces sp. MNP-20]